MLRYVEVHNMADSIQRRRESIKAIAKPTPQDYLAACDRQTLDLVASFQRAVVDDLVSKTLAAAVDHGVATLLVTGGVAANSELRTDLRSCAPAEEGIPVLFPSRKLSTDNAAMIAAAAYPRFPGARIRRCRTVFRPTQLG